jgi:hypothetical protein
MNTFCQHAILPGKKLLIIKFIKNKWDWKQRKRVPVYKAYQQVRCPVCDLFRSETEVPDLPGWSLDVDGIIKEANA